MSKKIDEIAGMSDIVKSLYNAGKIPREIREELLKKYSDRQVPSISVIYSYVNNLGKQEADMRIKLTGNIQHDAQLTINLFDSLMDKIFNRYNITFQDKKLSQVDLTFFKAQLREFINEAISSNTKFNKMVEFYYLYWANDVILPLLNELDINKTNRQKIMKKLEKAVEDSEKINIDEYIARYTG